MFQVQKFVLALAELPESCEFGWSSLLNKDVKMRAFVNIQNGNIPEYCKDLFGKSLVLCVIARLPPDDSRWDMATNALLPFARMAQVADKLKLPLSSSHYRKIARDLRDVLSINDVLRANRGYHNE